MLLGTPKSSCSVWFSCYTNSCIFKYSNVFKMVPRLKGASAKLLWYFPWQEHSDLILSNFQNNGWKLRLPKGRRLRILNILHVWLAKCGMWNSFYRIQRFKSPTLRNCIQNTEETHELLAVNSDKNQRGKCLNAANLHNNYARNLRILTYCGFSGVVLCCTVIVAIVSLPGWCEYIAHWHVGHQHGLCNNSAEILRRNFENLTYS